MSSLRRPTTLRRAALASRRYKSCNRYVAFFASFASLVFPVLVFRIETVSSAHSSVMILLLCPRPLLFHYRRLARPQLRVTLGAKAGASESKDRREPACFGSFFIPLLCAAQPRYDSGACPNAADCASCDTTLTHCLYQSWFTNAIIAYRDANCNNRHGNRSYQLAMSRRCLGIQNHNPFSNHYHKRFRRIQVE